MEEGGSGRGDVGGRGGRKRKEIWRKEDGGEGMKEGEGMDEVVWGREYGVGRGDEGGGWIRIKYDTENIEYVEHNTTIGNNVMNEYGI